MHHSNYDSTWTQKWDELYGHDVVTIRHGNGQRILSVTGAWRDVVDSSLTMIWGKGDHPPKDPCERLRLQIKFYNVKLEKAVKAFDDYKRAIKSGSLPSDQQAAIAHLKALRDNVKDFQSKVGELEAELHNLEHPPMPRELFEAINEGAKLRMEFEQAIDQVEI